LRYSHDRKPTNPMSPRWRAHRATILLSRTHHRPPIIVQTRIVGGPKARQDANPCRGCRRSYMATPFRHRNNHPRRRAGKPDHGALGPWTAALIAAAAAPTWQHSFRHRNNHPRRRAGRPDHGALGPWTAALIAAAAAPTWQRSFRHRNNHPRRRAGRPDHGALGPWTAALIAAAAAPTQTSRRNGDAGGDARTTTGTQPANVSD
jgi:hypothetical protein